jgi:DNA-binding transcriptional MerR regulator
VDVTERNRPVYSIGAVERLVGLSAATIRTWETRYGLVSPVRSEGGQRLYSRDQVDQLRFIKRTIEGGRRPGEAHRVLAQRLETGNGAGLLGPRALVADCRDDPERVLSLIVGATGAAALAAGAADLVANASVVVVVDPADLELEALGARLREAGAGVVELELPGNP